MEGQERRMGEKGREGGMVGGKEGELWASSQREISDSKYIWSTAHLICTHRALTIDEALRGRWEGRFE